MVHISIEGAVMKYAACTYLSVLEHLMLLDTGLLVLVNGVNSILDAKERLLYFKRTCVESVQYTVYMI